MQYKKLETSNPEDVVKFFYENIGVSELHLRKTANVYIAEAMSGVEPPNPI